MEVFGMTEKFEWVSLDSLLFNRARRLICVARVRCGVFSDSIVRCSVVTFNRANQNRAYSTVMTLFTGTTRLVVTVA